MSFDGFRQPNAPRNDADEVETGKFDGDGLRSQRHEARWGDTQ